MSSYVRHKIYSPANTQKVWITEYACHVLPLHWLWWAYGILNGQFLHWGKKRDFISACLLLTQSGICEGGEKVKAKQSEKKMWKTWVKLKAKKRNKGLINVAKKRKDSWRSSKIPWKNSRHQSLLMWPIHEGKESPQQSELQIGSGNVAEHTEWRWPQKDLCDGKPLCLRWFQWWFQLPGSGLDCLNCSGKRGASPRRENCAQCQLTGLLESGRTTEE